MSYKNRAHWLAGLFWISMLQMSCKPIERLEDGLDRWSFGMTGGTVFSNPFLVSTKQLHFDTGDLFGKDVVLEGEVIKKGEAGTYLVLKDGDGRILVVMTQLESSSRELEGYKSGSLRVLGRLERGKKGLPYVLAKAIKAGEGSAPSLGATSKQ